MAVVPIASLLRYHAAHNPDGAVAVAMGRLDDRELISWEALERRANRRAAQLKASGVRHDDLVTVALTNSVAFHETAFGIWKAGATPNVIPPSLPAAELRAILETARPRVIVGERSLRVDRGWPLIVVDDSLQGFDDAPCEEAPATYFKAMTSGGSTGRPKIIVDHTPALWDPEQAMFMQPRDGVILNPGPLYHNAAFLFVHVALFAGTRVSTLTRFDPEEVLRVVAGDRVQWAFFVPTMMNRIAALPDAVRGSYDVSSLEVVFHGAAAIAPSVKLAWLDWLGPDRLIEAYSATEALGGTLITGREWLAKRGSVGRPLAGTQVKVVTEDGRLAQPGEVGEIYLMPPRGPGSSYHYIGAEPKADADGWESVGDIGWLDEDGYLFLADRRVDLIIRGGANIYPAEIEGALEAHPSVACAVVIGLPDEDLGQRAHALVELKNGANASAQELQEFLATSLARYKVPESFEFIGQPLRDDAGKVRRSLLREERIERIRAGLWRPELLSRRSEPAGVERPHERRPGPNRGEHSLC